ncbi:MAG: DUF4234 domain-containing protein [Clostridia bacterium]|nr:DUF4234 domain-containing protein [Clostridia bacterium]
MYTRINWITWWLLNIVTCGIYGIYIWYKMTKDLNDMAEKVDEKPVMGYILQLLLGCVTCGIYSIVWMFQFFGLMSRLSDKYGAEITPESSFVKVIISIIPIYSFYWMADAYNKLADKAEA